MFFSCQQRNCTKTFTLTDFKMAEMSLTEKKQFEHDVGVLIFRRYRNDILPSIVKVTWHIEKWMKAHYDDYNHHKFYLDKTFKDSDFYGNVENFEEVLDSKDFNVHLGAHARFFSIYQRYLKKEEEKQEAEKRLRDRSRSRDEEHRRRHTSHSRRYTPYPYDKEDRDFFKRVSKDTRPKELFDKDKRGRIELEESRSPVRQASGFFDKSENRSLYIPGYKTYKHSRGYDKFKLDDQAVFVKNANAQKILLSAGPSGTSADLFSVAAMRLSNPEEIRNYVLGVISKMIIQGAHSLHEVMIIAQRAFPNQITYGESAISDYGFLDQFEALRLFHSNISITDGTFFPLKKFSSSPWDNPDWAWKCPKCRGGEKQSMDLV